MPRESRPPSRFVEDQPALYCHEHFLDHRYNEAILQHVNRFARLLTIAPHALGEIKTTAGQNRGWYRFALGGSGGYHFYAWWAPRGSPQLRYGHFDEAPPGAVFLRAIRHHDDHSPLSAGDFRTDYMPFSSEDIRSGEYLPSPFTPAQLKFADDRSLVRVLKGHPGSGKTWALWDAVDKATQSIGLYLTYSHELTTLAQANFQRLTVKTVVVNPIAAFFADLAGTRSKESRLGRRAFFESVKTFRSQQLGLWANHINALYNEIHAHLIGTALPEAVGRYPQCREPRLSPRVYRERREKLLEREAVTAVLEVVRHLEKSNDNFVETYFPELALAWRVATAVCSNRGPDLLARFSAVDCIAVDEVQDLTPLEAFIIIRTARRIREARASGGSKERGLTLLFAGDESQTVRATDFEWAWLNDFLHLEFTAATEFALVTNLRNPKRIARLNQEVCKLYRTVGKADRPRGYGISEIETERDDRLIHCNSPNDRELTQLLWAFFVRAGTAIVHLSETRPSFVPDEIAVVTPTDIKGLDFGSICLLNAGAHLNAILSAPDWGRTEARLEAVERRLNIDELRVVVSRPTERIYFLDVDATEEEAGRSTTLLEQADPGDVLKLTPQALLQLLESEVLDATERLQLYIQDAKALLSIPALAWSRVQQMLSLLESDNISDEEMIRAEGYLMASRVAFSLAIRRTAPDGVTEQELWTASANWARLANADTAAMLVELIYNAADESSLTPAGFRVLELLEAIQRLDVRLEEWRTSELRAYAAHWISSLEDLQAELDLAHRLIRSLPTAYAIFGIIDGIDGTSRLGQIKGNLTHALIAGKRFRTALAILRPNADEVQPISILDLRAAAHRGLGHLFSAASLYRAAARQSNLTAARTWLLRSIETVQNGHTRRYSELADTVHFDLATVCFLSAIGEEELLAGSRGDEFLAETILHLRLAPRHFPDTAEAIEVFAGIVLAKTPAPSFIVDLVRIIGRNGARIAPWFVKELNRFIPEWSESVSHADLPLLEQFLDVPDECWKGSGLDSIRRDLLSSLYKRTEQLVTEKRLSEAMNIIGPVLNYYQRESHG